MMKVFLFATLLTATTAVDAQTVLWNGENNDLLSDGGFWNRATPTVIDEEGNKCLKITLKENPGGWTDEHRMAALPLGGVNMNGLRRITMRIKMAANHNVRVKLVKDGVYSPERLFWYGEANNWQKLTFEYGVGPNSEDITDTDNTVLEIWPYESEDKWGEEILIDDILLEGPVIDGMAARTLEDGSLTGNIVVTGTVRKGQYQCTWDGDWHLEDYDDFSVISSKLSADVTSLDFRGATVSDGDGPQLRNGNVNRIIYSATPFYENDNVIVDGQTSRLVLNDAYPFDSPEGFDAKEVVVNRNLYAGINTFVLPFWVNADEIDGNNGRMAIFKNQDTNKVVFEEKTGVGANTPFIMTDIVNSASELTFTNKGIVKTNGESLGSDFVGVYHETDGEGKWGIGNDDKFVKGATGAKVKTFHAYLDFADGVSARSVVFLDDTTTSIDMLKSEPQHMNAYSLSGMRIEGKLKSGLYLINNKKVFIK